MFFNQAVNYMTRHASRLCLFGLMAAALGLASCGGGGSGGGGGGGPARLACSVDEPFETPHTNWVCHQSRGETILAKQAVMNADSQSDGISRAFLVLSCSGNTPSIDAGFLGTSLIIATGDDIADAIAEIRQEGEYTKMLSSLMAEGRPEIPAHEATWDLTDANRHINDLLPCMPPPE